MSVEIYADARLALRTYLNGLTDLPGLFPGGISWQGQKFDPPIGQSYLRETVKEGQSRRMSLGPIARVRHNALYLLDCFSPNTAGVEGADALGDYMQFQFWPGLQCPGSSVVVRIVSSSAMGIVTDQNWQMKPITIQFWFDTFTQQ